MRDTKRLTWITRLGCLCFGPLPAPRARQAGEKDRGFILIGSYLMLSLLLIYASGITTSTNTQQLAMNRLNDRYEALNLSQRGRAIGEANGAVACADGAADGAANWWVDSPVMVSIRVARRS